MRKLTTEEFIEKARAVHGDFYNYNKTVYEKTTSNVTITCPIHGDFVTKAYLHLSGAHCAKCAGVRGLLTTELFVKEAREIHGDKYDYSKVVYTKSREKVEIVCPIHGSFWQNPNNHLSKRTGCPHCCNESMTLSNELFIEKARLIHGDKYDYSKVNYVNNRTKVEIICPIHGSFMQMPHIHLSKHEKGCPKCGRRKSKAEERLRDFLSKYVDIEANNRSILNGRELDIYCASKNVAIEYNGLYWHSEQGNRNTLLLKTKDCEAQGIKLIHVFEDEYNDKRKIVESRLLHALGVSRFGKIYARKCEVKEIDSKLSARFVLKYHIQGSVGASVHLGLYFKNRLVAVMTFGRSRFNKKYTWELLRYCTLSNFSVIGGASKLLQHFRRRYDGKIVTYADRRWSDGNLYRKLGFQLVSVAPPGYTYFKGAKGAHRYSRLMFQKHKLKDVLETFDSSKSEAQNMKENGYVKIYDCGNLTFEI